MGCWQETCVVTNTPILEDEKCLMFVFKGELGEFHDDYQHLLRCFVYAKEGKYNDYGSVRGAPEKFKGNRFINKKIKNVFISKEVIDKLRENWSISENVERFLFVHTNEIFKELYGNLSIQKTEHYELLNRLWCLLSSTRRSLFGTLGTQCQHGIEEEYETVMELTKARIATYKKLTKEDEDED